MGNSRMVCVASLIALVTTSCLFTPPQRFEALSVEDALINPSIINNIKYFDGPSFQKAECRYDQHIIPCGNYLLSRLAVALDKHPKVVKVSLTEFEFLCAIPESQFIVPDTECTTRMVTQIQTEDSLFHLSSLFNGIQKGHFAIGTGIQLLPILPWTHLADPAYNQIREAIGQLSINFSDGLRSKGL